jgi:magnesium and cobalt transporter
MEKSNDSSRKEPLSRNNDPAVGARRSGGLFAWLKNICGLRNGESALRDTFEELIEEHETREQPIDSDERMLLTNILKFGGLAAADVMIPRVDIVAVEIESPLQDVITLMTTETHSRVPVYRDTLDEVIGMVHMKDVLGASAGKTAFSLSKMLRKVLFVAPSMQVLDLLLQMRETRTHMALVVDEYGGIDGLVTIEDLVEEIVGEIEDEHDVGARPHMDVEPNGSLIADARVPVEEFEDEVGEVLTLEERGEDIDTLGGLVAHLTGRVPTRGELIVHKASGIEFEVLDADPRRVKRLRVLLKPHPSSAND